MNWTNSIGKLFIILVIICFISGCSKEPKTFHNIFNIKTPIVISGLTLVSNIGKCKTFLTVDKLQGYQFFGWTEREDGVVDKNCSLYSETEFPYMEKLFLAASEFNGDYKKDTLKLTVYWYSDFVLNWWAEKLLSLKKSDNFAKDKWNSISEKEMIEYLNEEGALTPVKKFLERIGYTYKEAHIQNIRFVKTNELSDLKPLKNKLGKMKDLVEIPIPDSHIEITISKKKKRDFSKLNKKTSFQDIYNLEFDVQLKEIYLSGSHKKQFFSLAINPHDFHFQCPGKTYCLNNEDFLDEEMAKIIKASLSLEESKTRNIGFDINFYRLDKAIKNWAEILKTSPEWNNMVKKMKATPSWANLEYDLVKNLMYEKEIFSQFKPFFKKIGYKLIEVSIEKISYPTTEDKDFKDLFQKFKLKEDFKLPVPLMTMLILEKV